MDQFIAEIRMFGCNYAPKGWAQCNGQILAISQNTALFSLIGIYYGGNGTTTFALPNFGGQAGTSFGQAPGLSLYTLGEPVGSPVVTLLSGELAVHNHPVNCFNDGGANPSPDNAVLASSGADSRGNLIYNAATTGNLVPMGASQVLPTGNNQPHNNMSPYLTVNYCIALQGVYPPRP